MAREAKIGLVVGLGALVGLALALSEPPDPGRLAPAPKPPNPPPPNPPPPPPDPNGRDDETALARMLVSETNMHQAWPVIGWMAIQTAKNRKQTLFERLTAGQGYGPRVKNGVERYASTSANPTPTARNVARQLLSGALKPSQQLRELGHSSWVELLKGTEQEAEQLLRKQTAPKNWGGVFARIAGTDWYLLNPKEPPVKWTKGGALKALRAVSEVAPRD
jgi:hypothetical protein